MIKYCFQVLRIPESTERCQVVTCREDCKKFEWEVRSEDIIEEMVEG